MATKGGIPRVGVEQYNTNIKAPGINKGTGAYFTGKVEKIADYSKVNDSIQKSIKQAGEDLGQFMASERERTSLDPEMAAELGLDPKGSYNRGDFIASQMTDGMSRKEARQAWRKAKKGSDPVDVDDTSIEEKKSIVAETADTIGEKSENSYQKAAEDLLGGKNFNQLNRRQKILAKKNLNKLAKSKENIATLMGEWAGAEVDDISWKKYGSHPEVSDFMQYIIGGEGAAKDLPYTFSNENGGTIVYGDGKKLLMRDLEAGKNIYATADNKQLKKDVAATTKNNVAILNKAEDEIIKTLNDQTTKPEDPAYSYNRETNIRDMVKAEYNSAMYEDVWNAEMRGRFTKGRYVNYNSDKHEALVQDYLFEQYNEKMGEQNPLVTRDMSDISNKPTVEKVAPGKVRVDNLSGGGGYKDVDVALYDRVRNNILPLFQKLSETKSETIFDKNNPLPAMDDTRFEGIEKKISDYKKDQEKPVEQREGLEAPTEASKNLIKTISSTRGAWSRVFDSAEDVLNAAIKKANKIKKNPDSGKLSSDEQEIVNAYMEYQGIANNMVDIPDTNFDEKSKVTQAQLNKTSKKVRLYINGKSKTFNLNNETSLESFMALVVGRTGDRSTEGTYILKQFLKELNIEYNIKPDLPTKKKEEKEEAIPGLPSKEEFEASKN